MANQNFSFVVLSGCLGLLVACARPFCEAQGLQLVIENLPVDISNYTVRVVFEDRELEADCANESFPCESTDGPWTLSVGFDPRMIISVEDDGDDFSTFAPHGTVHVFLSSSTSTFTAEHTFEPTIEGGKHCEWALEEWDVAMDAP